MDEVQRENYKRAIEKALSLLPVKNGLIHIKDIWLETSLPMDLIKEIVQSNSLKLPDNVKGIRID